MLDIGLNLSIAELATDETLSVEDGVVGVHGDLVLGSVTNQSLTLAEGDIGGGGTVTLVVGDDLDTIVLPDTDTSEEQNSCTDLYVRVSSTEIDTNGSIRCVLHFLKGIERKKMRKEKERE